MTNLRLSGKLLSSYRLGELARRHQGRRNVMRISRVEGQEALHPSSNGLHFPLLRRRLHLPGVFQEIIQWWPPAAYQQRYVQVSLQVNLAIELLGKAPVPQDLQDTAEFGHIALHHAAPLWACAEVCQLRPIHPVYGEHTFEQFSSGWHRTEELDRTL